MPDEIDHIRAEIENDPANARFTADGIHPLFTASPLSRIVIVGQAPGRKAQESGVPWNDQSGERLREWLGVSDEQFYDPDQISLLPMDFYFPGKGKSGDLPPRSGFASKWHSRLLALMPDVRLTVLIGRYAQKQYLAGDARRTLTETVREFREYGPGRIPLVHPSPLNFRWQAKNPWFDAEVIPELRKLVGSALA